MNKQIVLIIAFLGFVHLLPAQSSDSTLNISMSTDDLMPVLNPWLSTSNPAGMQFNPAIQPGALSLNYLNEKGDFKRAQQGDTLNQYYLKTHSFKNINNTWLFGSFSYDKSFEKGCNYTLNDDPYRGSPYLLIDTANRNDIYDREFFNLRGDISTQLLNRLAWGLSVDIDAGLSSQDRDPRPRNKVMNVDVSQGLIYNTEYFSIGANALYSYYNEDIEVDIIEENTQMAFLQLHGFDNYTSHMAESFNRLYRRSEYGGEGQLVITVGGLKSLFGSKLLYFIEAADDGRKAGDASWSYMKNDAQLEGNRYKIFNYSTFKHGKFLHHFNVQYNLKYAVGAEFLQRLEQVGEAGAVNWVDYGIEEKYTFNQTDMSAGYRFILLKDPGSSDLEINIALKRRSFQDSYFLPDQSKNFSNRYYMASAIKSFFPGKNEIKIGAGIEKVENLENSFNIGRESFLNQNLLTPDFEYLTADHTQIWAQLSYARKLDRIFNKIFINGRISQNKTNNQKRQVYQVSTGVIF